LQVNLVVVEGLDPWTPWPATTPGCRRSYRLSLQLADEERPVTSQRIQITTGTIDAARNVINFARFRPRTPLLLPQAGLRKQLSQRLLYGAIYNCTTTSTFRSWVSTFLRGTIMMLTA